MKSNITIQSLLTQAPYITIQGLFQQSTLEEITGINKFLQENIRTQGISLKKIFESKYLDLVNCSQLLQKVNDFAERIDTITGDIKSTVNLQNEADCSIKKSDDKLVQKIELLVRRNQFLEAIKQCLQSKLKEPVLFEVVLFETVENIMHKALSKINQQTLLDLIQAISLFLSREGEEYLRQEGIQQQYGSNIAILSKYFKRMKDKSTRSHLLASINSLFEIKIKKAHIDKHSSQFSHFIEDLLLMIDTIENKFYKIDRVADGNQSTQQLSLEEIKQAYIQNFERIKASLSTQMITSVDKKLFFNFDFYNSMLADNHLLQKFELLESKLSSTNTISQVLRRLWSDFYHQFVAYVLNELNTFEWVYHEVSGLTQQKFVFPEFKRHLKDSFALNMLTQGRKYKQTTRALLNQIKELIRICSEQDAEALLIHFRTQMKRYLEQNSNNFVQLFQSLSDNNERLKTCMVTLTFQTYFIGNVLNLDNHQIMNQIIEENQIKIEQALKTVLVQYAKNTPFHEDIERMFEGLEEICMPLVVYLKQREEKQSFKIFILWLLESIASTLEGKNLQKVNYTISFILQKPVISQHQPLFHFLPIVLFNIKNQSEHRPFNLQYYQFLLQNQQSRRVSNQERRDVMKPAAEDLFDIGQKQPSTNTSKMTSQKLLSLGGQFVGGLINRIRQPL